MAPLASPVIVIAWTLCLAQIVIGAATWYAARRIARRLDNRSAIPPSPSTPHIVIAATGPLPGLERLRDALASQTVPIGGLTFAVEATADPAFDRLSHVFASFPAPVAIVTAGLATRGAQKSLNLAKALREVDERTPIVLADADIVPQRTWLATLLRPIDLDKADIVTGYRWPVALDARPPTLVIAWIDRAIAALPRFVGGALVWGGSTALAPGICARIGLADRLAAQISDDMFLTRLAREHRLRVTFTTGALLATPTAHGWASMAGFGRRQYQMVRLYVPPAYFASLAVTLFNLVGTAAPLLLLSVTWWAAVAYGAIVGTAACASAARTRLGAAASIRPDSGAGERGLLLVAIALPVVHLAHLLMIVTAFRVRKVVWGHCTYRMRGKRVISIGRRPYRSSLSS